MWNTLLKNEDNLLFDTFRIREYTQKSMTRLYYRIYSTQGILYMDLNTGGDSVHNKHKT